MERLAYVLALVAIAASAAVIAVTSSDLPVTVASHFGAGGVANGAMSRDHYRMLMLALAILLPATILLAMTVLPRLVPTLVNLPHAKAWLLSEHRANTLSIMGTHGALLAIVLSVFTCVAHLMIVHANALVPPHIDSAARVGAVGTLMLVGALWAASLMLRFRRPPP